MRSLAILLLVFASTAQAAPCVSYISETEIVGTLSRHTFPEQPGYESVVKGDAKATYYFVSPFNQLCVVEGNLGENEPAESHISKVQLVLSKRDPTDVRSHLGSLVGSSVRCTGKVFHSVSGHHHSPVLLGEAVCSAVQPGVQADRP